MSDALRTPGVSLLVALSREVREPLRAVTSWLAVLAAGSDDPVVVRRAVRGLEQIVRQQTELADDLLEVARLAAARVPVQRRRVELTGLAATCIERQRATARTAGVELRLEAAAAVDVAADEARLRMAVERLLRVAIHRTPAGQSVSVRAASAGRGGEIVIRGASGDPSDSSARAAQETDAVGPAGGGLGLVLARQLIEVQGGELATDREAQGHGATFAVHLPSWRENGPSLLPHAVPRERVLEDARLLVVDDDPIALEALSQALVAHGARVAVAPSALGALDRLQNEAFDAVCSDLDMPGGSGLTLARAVRTREIGGGRALPLVAVTGQLGDESERAARLAGFDIYLTKPLSIPTLVRCLRMLIDDAHRRR